jgi:hypothetical protein
MAPAVGVILLYTPAHNVRYIRIALKPAPNIGFHLADNLFPLRDAPPMQLFFY